jgi:hypothetical protein
MLASLLLPALVLLEQVSAQVNTKSLVTCYTRQGPKSTSTVKTTSNVLTLPWYALKVTTSTPSTTITSAVSTTTSTTTEISTTKTVLPTITDTATETSQTTTTIVTIADAIITVLTEFTSTTVTTTETSTISAPAGFIPVETSFAGALKRRADAGPQVVPALHERAARSEFHIENGKHVSNPVAYPQAVRCAGLVVIVTTTTRTKTASSTLTILAPTSVVTSTVIETSVTTFTSQPRAETTTTVTEAVFTTSKSTPVVTSTTTITNTATVAAPQATLYAACADNNIASKVNGVNIFGGYSYSQSVEFLSAANPYECCVACQNFAGCGATIFLQKTCYTWTFTTSCSQVNRALSLLTNTGYTGEGYTISNGPCGFIDGAYNEA